MDNFRDRNNAPDTYSEDVSSREFRDRPRAAAPRRSDDYPPPDTRDRRKSILVDPNDRAQRPRGARRNSQVRLQSSDDEGGGYIPVRRPPIGSEASKVDRDMASRHDLERKDTQAHRSFREKRDGYESDEGETLRRKGIPPEPRGPPPRRDGPPPGGDPRQRPQGRGAPPPPRAVDPRDMEPREMPVRTRAPPVQYGNVPVDPRRNRNEYLDAGPDPRLGRSTSQRAPRARPPPQYGYDDDDDYRPPPRRQASQRDPRGDPRRRPRDDYDDDRGYRTDRDTGRRPGPRYDDYYSDGGHSRGHNRPPPYYDQDRSRRRDSYGGGYARGRDGSRGRRDRYRDDYDDGDRGGRRGKNGDLQATVATAFATYAMPMIKKEGTKFLRKQMQEFMTKQGGR